MVVQTFEMSPEGSVLFAAQWRLLRSAPHTTLIAERLAIVERVHTESDASIVAAMSRALEASEERAAAGTGRIAFACGMPNPRQG